MTQNSESAAPVPTGARTVRSPDDLSGPAGRLEALYVPGPANAHCAAIMCHPHPLFGGTMHNKVVYHAAKVFEELGLPVLRFNFRGAGKSEGMHDRGEGERDDLRAAMHWLHKETGLPLLVGGFSFGAWVSLRTCCEPPESDSAGDERVQGIVALGLPIQAGDRGYSYEFLQGCGLPRLFISGAADAFGSVQAVEAAIAPAPLVAVPGANHFFQRADGASGLGEMQASLRSWLRAGLEATPGQQEARRDSAELQQVGGC